MAISYLRYCLYIDLNEHYSQIKLTYSFFVSHAGFTCSNKFVVSREFALPDIVHVRLYQAQKPAVIEISNIL